MLRVVGVAVLIAILSCAASQAPGKQEDNPLIWKMPKMDDLTCYSAPTDNRFITCTDGSVLPQDPTLIKKVFEVTLSFFPTVEAEDDLRVVVIYQSSKAYEKRMFKRLPIIEQAERDGVHYFVFAHTYFDPVENAVVIECNQTMGIKTMIHEFLHHVFMQIAEENILDHPILERTVNLIVEHPRMREALRETT